MSEQDSGAGHSSTPPGPGGPEGAAGDLLLHLRPEFALEVEQACARLGEDLRALGDPGLEGPGAEAHLARARRLMHGLRGTAATLGAAEVHGLAASLERELSGERERSGLTLPLPRAAADALLQGLEQLVRLAREWAR